MSYSIKVGARDSRLSQVQVEEVHEELKRFHPGIQFEKIFLKTRGDLDRKTSLKEMEKTDFFTRELDEMVLKGVCRIAIHSAKDLPDPLPNGLKQIALTKGVDSSDVLVLRENEYVQPGFVIATSSERREAMIKKTFNDVKLVEIRGTIEERLAQLDRGEVGGVVMALAALIRLKIKRNWIKLSGEPAPMQGKLAVIAKEDDLEMDELFKCLEVDQKD